mmetsp:Transcript_41447/g.81232  ORF Transcript_41447/g.81232 Transcript_41447/m.81232 type:complete len:260 (-) Transcript_41447:433-1212(-)
MFTPESCPVASSFPGIFGDALRLVSALSQFLSSLSDFVVPVYALFVIWRAASLVSNAGKGANFGGAKGDERGVGGGSIDRPAASIPTLPPGNVVDLSGRYVQIRAEGLDNYLSAQGVNRAKRWILSTGIERSTQEIVHDTRRHTISISTVLRGGVGESEDAYEIREKGDESGDGTETSVGRRRFLDRAFYAEKGEAVRILKAPVPSTVPRGVGTHKIIVDRRLYGSGMVVLQRIVWEDEDDVTKEGVEAAQYFRRVGRV